MRSAAPLPRRLLCCAPVRVSRPRAMAAAEAAPSGSEASAAPAWVSALASRPGITSPPTHSYWESDVQPHGDDTVISWLHEGEEPASHGGRVYLHEAARRVYGVWPLGRRVCGHPGLVHGGVTALLLDEMFGQARSSRSEVLGGTHSLNVSPLTGLLGLVGARARPRLHRQPERGLQGARACAVVALHHRGRALRGGTQGALGRHCGGRAATGLWRRGDRVRHSHLPIHRRRKVTEKYTLCASEAQSRQSSCGPNQTPMEP